MQRTVNPCRKTMWERYPPDQPYGTVAQLARASDCLSEGRGFEPHQSRHFLFCFVVVQLEEPRILVPVVSSSSLDDEAEKKYAEPQVNGSST